MTTKVRKWGNSLGVRIPQRLAQTLNIEDGSVVELSEDKQGILIRPVKEVVTLENLLSKITEDNQHEELDFGKTEGDEIW